MSFVESAPGGIRVSKAHSEGKTLNLQFFGTWRACLGEEPLPALRSRKGEWLLALLVIRGSAVPRSWLAGTLWPDSDESRALLYLRRELTFLRKALGTESHRLSSAGRTLAIDLSGVDCDVLRFDSAIKRGDESSLELAVSRYSGPLLDGCDEEWVMPERASREQAYLAALERLAEMSAERGDSSAASARLRAIVAVDPLRESAQRALMLALADSGDSAAVVQVYRDLRLYLHREINADVDTETTSVFESIRDRARLPKKAASVGGSASVEARFNRIPIPLTPLVGRRQEIEEAWQRVRSSRLLTLTGTGGVGKTRLAIEMADVMKDEFGGGVCFVGLGPLSDGALVPQAVMDGLGLKPEPQRTVPESLADRLRDSELLLILDNCEHLLQPIAELAGDLLAACSRLRILTTSREPLGIAGETVWRIPPLSVPPPIEPVEWRDKNLISELMEYESIGLFIERARQVSANFRLSIGNMEAVSRVCRHLDGIPLALEMAAARLRSLSIEDVENRLEQRFRLLTGGSRIALPHHKTLRSLVDWSYDLLSESEQALLIRLSVFRGGWSLESAERVCSGGTVDALDVLELLTSLCDKSLVVAETTGPSVRYRFLETIREYALDRLQETGEYEVWRDRHLAHFVALGEEAEPHLTDQEQPRWLERLELEHDNIRAALEWSRVRPEGYTPGLRLAGAICRFWSFHGHNLEGRTWMSDLLQIEPEKQNPAVRAKALHGAAFMAFDQGDVYGARNYADEDLAIRRELGDRRGIANALNVTANLAHLEGDYAAELTIREEGLAIWRALGDRWGVALSLGNLGFAANTRRDYELARVLLEESLAIRRELNVLRGIAFSLHQLGLAVHALGDRDSAREMYEESLAIDRELGNWRGVANLLRCLAKLGFENGDFRTAWSHFGESLATYRELCDRLEFAICLELAAPLFACAGECRCAAQLWGAADRLREDVGAPRPPSELAEYRQQFTDARGALGSDTEFDAAWQQGRVMTLEQAMEVALIQSHK
jgi:predicted ATPase/DNA-binding SARP family transcriptional activator